MPRSPRSPSRAPVWKEVVVRTRHLDTQTTSVRILERCVPSDQQRQRLQLIDVVEELCPGARNKSFADGVASFVDGANLIVARYGEEVAPPPDATLPPDIDELRLFEDVA